MAYNTSYIELSPSVQMDNVILSDETKVIFAQFLKEFKYREVLQSHNLPVTNKLLLYGPSGCGKTYTAKALATSLRRKLIIADLSNIVSARLGQTAQNVSLLFQQARIKNAVLFLDEFDSLATERSANSRESGEMRRVVNTIIQLIDQMDKNTLLIAATNQLPLLDFALVRRFQQRIEFQLPHKELLNNYYDLLLQQFPIRFREIKRRYDVSFAEAEDQTVHQIKAQIIKEAEEAEEAEINQIIK